MAWLSESIGHDSRAVNSRNGVICWPALPPGGHGNGGWPWVQGLPPVLYNSSREGEVLSIIFVFLDGVGLGPPGEGNPFPDGEMPALSRLLGGPLVSGREVDEPGLLLRPLDACLGVPGLPQSASGQVALFTGVNAAGLLGRHLPAYPNRPLIELIEERCILKSAGEMRLRATFANAYTPFYFEWVAKGLIRHSATTLCVLAAGLPFRSLDDLERGEAVFWDITHQQLATRYRRPVNVPLIEPEVAGKRLARLGGIHDLVLFESFLPDLFGHRPDPSGVGRTLEILDRFLISLLAAVEDETTVLVTSDHGNLEDLTVRTHTRNPVPLLVVGPEAEAFRHVDAITGVTPAILSALEP